MSVTGRVGENTVRGLSHGALETTVKGLAILLKAGDSSEGLKQGNGVFQKALYGFWVGNRLQRGTHENQDSRGRQ